MKRSMMEAPEIALYRACHGMGIMFKMMEHPFRFFVGKRQETIEEVCPQCDGNGRMTVGAEIELDIRPYKSEEQEK